MYQIDPGFNIRDIAKKADIPDFVSRHTLVKAQWTATQMAYNQGEFAVSCLVGVPIYIDKDKPAHLSRTTRNLVLRTGGADSRVCVQDDRGSLTREGIKYVNGDLLSDDRFWHGDSNGRLEFSAANNDGETGLFISSRGWGATFYSEDFPRANFYRLKFTPSGRRFAVVANTWKRNNFTLMSRGREDLPQTMLLDPSKRSGKATPKTFTYTQLSIPSTILDISVLDDNNFLIVTSGKEEEDRTVRKVTYDDGELTDEIVFQGFENRPYLIAGNEEEMFIAQKGTSRYVDPLWINQDGERTISIDRLVAINQ